MRGGDLVVNDNLVVSNSFPLPGMSRVTSSEY